MQRGELSQSIYAWRRLRIGGERSKKFGYQREWMANLVAPEIFVACFFGTLL